MPTISGYIKSRSEVGFTSNDKRKRTFILDCSSDKYKNFLEFVLYGDAVHDLKRYKNKEYIHVSYNPKGQIMENKGKEKIYQSLVPYLIESDDEKIARLHIAKMTKK